METISQEKTGAPVPSVWAVDPREQKTRPNEDALKEIRPFLGGSFAGVHPIYICNDDKQNLEDLRGDVAKYLEPLHLEATYKPEVYRSPSNAKGDRPKRLLNLAHSTKSKAILLSSHGRSALGNLLLGSFSSALLKETDIPVVFLHAHASKHEKLDKVLFATDFSEGSQEIFNKFLDFVGDHVSRVILSHIISFPNQSVGFTEAGYAMASFLEDQTEWAENQAAKWIREVKDQKKRDLVVDIIEESTASPAFAVESLARREKVCLIGMASKASAIEGVIFGGVAQHLVSQQDVNLWIYPARQAE